LGPSASCSVTALSAARATAFRLRTAISAVILFRATAETVLVRRLELPVRDHSVKMTHIYTRRGGKTRGNTGATQGNTGLAGACACS
jgi:hypothetical protein